MTRCHTVTLLALMMISAWAGAADFRSAAEPATVLYDAPSVKARKLYIVNRGYPLEVVVKVGGWIKVRDAAGELTWAEAKTLDTARYVLVKPATLIVRQKPAEDAPAAFAAQRDALLETVDTANAGWIHVRQRDGVAGYVRVADVWGG